MPYAVTLLSPLVVIAFAILTKEDIYSLYLGIVLAAFILKQYKTFATFLSTCRSHIIQSIGDVSHACFVLLTYLLGGLIVAISSLGGSSGTAYVFAKSSKTRMSVQMVILFPGSVISFDLYGNSLVLVNTMRLVSDRMRIFREK